MSYRAPNRCTYPSQLTIFEKSHSDCSSAPRPVYPDITSSVSSNPVKDGGRRNTVVQIVAHHDAAYPVVADPWLWIDLIQSASWVSDAQGFTLMVASTS